MSLYSFKSLEVSVLSVRRGHLSSSKVYQTIESSNTNTLVTGTGRHMHLATFNQLAKSNH